MLVAEIDHVYGINQLSDTPKHAEVVQKSSKVYPSVQTREILKCEQLCSKIAGLLDTCAEEEGMNHNAWTKSRKVRTKLEVKLGDDGLKKRWTP